MRTNNGSRYPPELAHDFESRDQLPTGSFKYDTSLWTRAFRRRICCARACVCMYVIYAGVTTETQTTAPLLMHFRSVLKLYKSLSLVRRLSFARGNFIMSIVNAALSIQEEGGRERERVAVFRSPRYSPMYRKSCADHEPSLAGRFSDWNAAV